MLNELRSSKKGQYFSFDAIIATVIFVLTLIMLLSYWQSVKTYLDYQANDLNKEATRISSLIFTPPTGTDCTSLKRLGLANSWTDKRMNESLLQCVEKNMKPSDLKSSLGASFNVSVVITDLQDKSKSAYVLGDDPEATGFSDNLKEVVIFTRVGTLDTGTEDHMATVELYVYR